MTGEVESQNEMLDENGLPGPGAPTPLSALEVSRGPLRCRELWDIEKPYCLRKLVSNVYVSCRALQV